MSLLITDAIQGLADPTYTQLPTGIVDPACLQVVTINGALRITIKKNSLDGSYFTGDFIPNGSITQAQLANNCVGTNQLQDGAVTTAKLADHSVTQIKLAFGAVTNTEIATGTIQSGNIAPNAIVTTLINPGSVTGPCIANAAITSVNLSPGAVNTAALQAACVTVPNLGSDVLSLIQGTGLPSGVILPMARSALPTGYLWCDGSYISRTVYASLYAAIGTIYGPGDGATTFNLPDLRGRAIVGAGQATGYPNPTNFHLGGKGGEEAHYLTVHEMPSHNHPTVDNGHQHPVNEIAHGHQISQTPHQHPIVDVLHYHYINTGQGGKYVFGNQSVYGYGCIDATGGPTAVMSGYTNINHTENANAIISLVTTKTNIQVAGASTTIYNTAVGDGAPHNVMQPYLVCNYVIKT